MSILRVGVSARTARRGLGGSAARSARVASLAVLVLLATALAAAALPSSLRTREDAEDVAEAFVQSLVAGDVKTAYRTLGRYWPAGVPELADRIAASEVRRAGLRKTLGLSLGGELVAEEEIGERVLRITWLERFDTGALVWRLVFYRADRAWVVVGLHESEDLGTLFPTR